MAKFAVIGLGKFGWTVATTLFDNGAEIVAIDWDQKQIEEIRGRVSAAVKMDSTDETALRHLGIAEMDGVILAIGSNIEVSVLTCAILKKLGAGPIYAKADSKLHRRILEMIGINHIVFPEEQIGIQLAQSLISSNVLDYVNLSTGHTLVEIEVPSDYLGKTLQELALPSRYGINIIAIKYDHLNVTDYGENYVERKVNDMPGANDVIKEGNTLVLLGSSNKINQLLTETAQGRR